MKTNYEIRYAAHPEDAKSYDTARIRRDFLIEKVFAADEVNMVYSMYDRMVVGGAMPVNEELKLEAQKYPMKRFGKPEEVAYGIIYLLSDASTFCTGSSIVMDGGFTLQ